MESYLLSDIYKPALSRVIIRDFERKVGLEKGTLVRYIGITDKTGVFLKHPQYCGHPSDPRGILNTETVYEIDHLIIARAYFKVKIVGFDEEFYPSIFELARKKFAAEDLEIIQNHFHTLIIERTKNDGWHCSEFLADKNKKLPEITNETFTTEAWYPVPGMYGGFAYKLIERDEKPLLVTSSWSRVRGGSGQRHEITTAGCVLVEKGFV